MFWSLTSTVTLIPTWKLTHCHIPRSPDDGWVYFLPLYPATVYSQLTLFKNKKQANEDASHTGLHLHSTLKCLRCETGNLKLDGWALKASAVVNCQSFWKQGAEQKISRLERERSRLFLQLLPVPKTSKKPARLCHGNVSETAQAIPLLASKQQMKIKSGISFPPAAAAAKHTGVTAEG